jgi:hypothetical protein
MRHVALASLLALVACGDRSPPPERSGAVPREHPLAQDGTVERGITSMPDRVKVQLDLAAARAAVMAYRAEKSAWPQSLEELSLAGINYPADLTYDPGTGRVGSQTYPTL